MKKTSLLECFSEVYEDAKRRISAGGKITRKIKINAGVKRACPLSPLLFKWIINELLDEIQELNVGIDVNAKLLCCIALPIILCL